MMAWVWRSICARVGNAERVIKAKIIKRFRMDIIAKELMFTKIKTIARAVFEVAMNIY